MCPRSRPPCASAPLRPHRLPRPRQVRVRPSPGTPSARGSSGDGSGRARRDGAAGPAARASDRPCPPTPPPAPGTRSAAPAPTSPSRDSGIDTFKLQMLVYSDVPAERLVFINNRKYVEGQMVEDKALLESITPDGAVLSYQGRRIVLRQ